LAKNIFLIFLFLFVIIFTYLQLLSHVSHDLQAMKPLSKLFTDKRSTASPVQPPAKLIEHFSIFGKRNFPGS
jgi:hypothetical protein